eukprot:1458411-Rhodomonas_salina.2
MSCKDRTSQHACGDWKADRDEILRLLFIAGAHDRPSFRGHHDGRKKMKRESRWRKQKQGKSGETLRMIDVVPVVRGPAGGNTVPGYRPGGTLARVPGYTVPS